MSCLPPSFRPLLYSPVSPSLSPSLPRSFHLALCTLCILSSLVRSTSSSFSFYSLPQKIAFSTLLLSVHFLLLYPLIFELSVSSPPLFTSTLKEICSAMFPLFSQLHYCYLLRINAIRLFPPMWVHVVE